MLEISKFNLKQVTKMKVSTVDGASIFFIEYASEVNNNFKNVQTTKLYC